ncbi:helix-turn-helix transcriptional regulator [Streptomyces sp. SID3343]|uniref:helix-turn-helix domain-containing protein n=1 Tax=Streptomyces sp. SID3343 TaxID=2690260 RepID=UPI00136A3171|nr:helix-turn-helix transcriptional regulator [Streptomyces sp. SID3343]MYW00305.1 helix-turn-helix domain-containing protein [Streptomyces sp. SID3343]
MAETPASLPPRVDDNEQGAPASRRPTAPRHEPLWRHVLGDHLRSLRHERGETLAETASRAGLSPQYLSEVERGIKEPSSEMIAAVGGALGATLVDLTLAVTENLKSTRPVGRSTTVCRSAFALVA